MLYPSLTLPVPDKLKAQNHEIFNVKPAAGQWSVKAGALAGQMLKVTMMMKSITKQNPSAAVIVTAMIIASVWICFVRVNAIRNDNSLQQRVGEVLAEQTARLLGKDGRIVCITMTTRDRPQLKIQLEAFKATLRRLGDYELRECELDPRDCGAGTGLPGQIYVQTIKLHKNTDVFVSFIGVPILTQKDIVELGGKPKLIAESRSADNLPALFGNHLIEIAVIPRFEFPPPGSTTQRTPEDRFTQRFEIVTLASAKSLPKLK
jgi:hypothetical protein